MCVRKTVNEHIIHKTKSQLKSLRKVSESKLNEMETTIFNNKRYLFQMRSKDQRFGEILIDDFAPNPDPAATRRRSLTSPIYQADAADDDDNSNAANRPPSKMLRIEIKPLIKKRYSIY